MTKQNDNASNKQNETLLLAAIMLFAAVLLFFGIYQLFAPQASAGAKAITIEVVDQTQTQTTYQVHTDAEYLIDAMKDTPEFTFSGYEGPYGLTLITINGITADWDRDQAYWCIYANGEMGSYGIDTQPVNDGDCFRFVYTGLTADA